MCILQPIYLHPCVAPLVVDESLQMYYICNQENLSGNPTGYQHKLVGQGSILFWLCLPATPVKQLYHAPNITGQTRQQRIDLSPIVVKRRVEVSPREINAVHAGVQRNGIPA